MPESARAISDPERDLARVGASLLQRGMLNMSVLRQAALDIKSLRDMPLVKEGAHLTEAERERISNCVSAFRWADPSNESFKTTVLELRHCLSLLGVSAISLDPHDVANALVSHPEQFLRYTENIF